MLFVSEYLDEGGSRPRTSPSARPLFGRALVVERVMERYRVARVSCGTRALVREPSLPACLSSVQRRKTLIKTCTLIDIAGALAGDAS